MVLKKPVEGVIYTVYSGPDTEWTHTHTHPHTPDADADGSLGTSIGSVQTDPPKPTLHKQLLSLLHI